ncbi:MAG: zinc protease [Candidatus Omnitrophota bacterium]|jgi:zinc protease
MVFIRRSIFICTVLLFSIILVTNTSAFDGNSKRVVLDNGLVVIVSEVPTSPLVAVYGLVKTGSATEGEYLGTGISHYLEHMLFKGTDKREVGEIAGEIQSLGGNINAATSKDYTIYTITVPDEHFDQGLDVLADMLQNSKIDADESASEKKVIVSEMRMINDRPERYMSSLVFSSIYNHHPYGLPIIGYKDIYEKITHKELADYYQHHYAPNNMILAISGNIKIEEVLPKIKEAFGAFERQNYVVRNLPQEPVQMDERFVQEGYATNVTRVSMGYRSVSILDDDLYALDVLASILGSGSLSRLNKKLYEEQQIVYGVSASNYTPIDPGVFEIELSLDYENLQEVVDEVKAQIELVKLKGVKSEELERIKNKEIANHVFSSQTATQIASQQMMNEYFTGDYKFSGKYVKGMGRVTNEDIKRVAKQYLIDKHLTTVALHPKEVNVKDDKASQEHEDSQYTKQTLDNGVRLLIKENNSFDLISIRLAIESGLRYDDDSLIGMSAMMMSLVKKGTKKYSFEQINDLTQSRGMHVGGFSGKNSSGFSLNFLVKDLDIALDLLEEFVKNPTFPQEHLDKSKRSTLKSIEGRQDNVFRYTAEILNESLFKNHPYRFREGGYEETIKNITREEMKEIYAERMTPENMVIAVSGRVKAENITKELTERFGDLKKGVVNKIIHQAAPILEKEKQILKQPKEQVVVLYGFQGPTIASPDRYKTKVLTGILGSSFNGRMFTNIRDKLGKAYTLGGFYVPGVDAGGMYFYVMTSKDNIEKVQELLEHEIKDLQMNLVSDKELLDLKNYLKGSFDASVETIDSLNYTVVLDELYGLGMEHYKNFGVNIDAVSKEDVKLMAQQYLDLNKGVVVISQPKEVKE